MTLAESQVWLNMVFDSALPFFRKHTFVSYSKQLLFVSALSFWKAISCVLSFYFNFISDTRPALAYWILTGSLLNIPDSIITACTLIWVLTCYFSVLLIRELYKAVNYAWAFWAFHQLKPLSALLIRCHLDCCCCSCATVVPAERN